MAQMLEDTLRAKQFIVSFANIFQLFLGVLLANKQGVFAVFKITI
jgi:hypothetical protein